ncbi:beta-xylosidase [Microbacterium sp. W4I4]|uniref:glycoside hydrolase family 43 protein n=1 Tax=Microbacterium sp. W4I4 TaxID=3042295 RepID=UPI002784FE81|nr:glycoside hydrolase 43 family protein [Microbacterium sp. W4I4]MDQ0613978.1 beta-xylosidase [Microbacterium sp. W4I4]
MQRRKGLFWISSAVLGVLAASVIAPSASSATEDFPFVPSITSTDNGDGTYDIPLLRSDVPDVSVARVPAAENDEGRDVYYMVSTTMHLSPGAPIMKSYDLVNWEIVNYAFDRISTGDGFSLRNGKSSYGQGQWASSIRYHEGTTYVLFNTNNLGGAYMLYTDDPENGTWERVQFGRGMHDPTLFFDDANGGDPYVFYGNGAQTAVKLDPENDWAIVEEYPNIFRQSDYSAEWTKGLFEGSQLAYIDGMYYMVMITSGSGWSRQVLILRSPFLLGKYDERSGGANTYEDHSGLNSNGYAQGSLVEVANGDGTTTWHGFFFRDTYPWGRIPALIPAVWPADGSADAGWPVFGRAGAVGYPDTFDHLITLDEDQANLARAKSIVTSDDFRNDAGRQPWTHEYERWGLEGDALDEVAYDGSDLRAQWEWNHAPDNSHWSLTDREGWLRLAPPSVVTGKASHRGGGDNAGGLTYLEEARNTLSQRVVLPRMSAETRLDFSGLNDGDTAGLAVYNRAFTYAAARKVDGELSIGLVERTPAEVRGQLGAIEAAEVEEFIASVPVPDGQDGVYLRVDTSGSDGRDLRARWFYSWDGQSWNALGAETVTAFGGWHPTHFMGPRLGLFSYATEATGGHADFDYLYLSDADPAQPVSADRVDAAITAAEALNLHDGATEKAKDVEFWLAEAQRAKDAGIHTHTQADAAVERLQLAVAEFLASGGEPKGELVSAVPSATVEKVNGENNRLTVTVTETWSLAGQTEISETFVIRNNAADTYDVGSYRVFVDTRGNVKIRDVSIVD